MRGSSRNERLQVNLSLEKVINFKKAPLTTHEIKSKIKALKNSHLANVSEENISIEKYKI